MLKRNLISLTALGGFVVLAAGSSPELIETIQQSSSPDYPQRGDDDDSDGGKNGDGGGSGSFDNNLDACKAYVAHYNGLDCLMGITLNAENTCPSNLNDSPIDMTTYYSCMIDHSSCNGSIPDFAGIEDCQMGI